MIFTAHLTDHVKESVLLGLENAIAAPAGARFAVHNPSTGDLLATLPDMGVGETRAAIEVASIAQTAWAARPAKERSAILRRWHDLILTHLDDLAAVLTAEMGKPLGESKSELQHAAAYIEWYAEEAKRVYGETFPAPSTDRRMLVIKQPVGVVGTITPWNFPASMVARKIAPALAVGCTVILKPAEQTPLIALAMHTLARRAGLPEGVFNLVLASEGDAIGRELCSNPKVRKISFTGSTEVGRILMRQCSDQIKKVSLELGGSAPFIVFECADIDAAVDGAIQAKFRNAGQTCTSANRFYVQAAVYDEFAGKLAEEARKLVVGDGFSPAVTIGPLIDERAMAKVEAHVTDAVSKGATLMCGGTRLEGAGAFYTPAVLSGVDRRMQVACDETFGPVAPIIRFETIEDVITEANDTIYGLAAYFYATELKKVWHVAEALEYGMIGINAGRMSSEAAPFGGLKQSGIGREGSRHGAEDYLEMKYLCMGNI
ncbi:succinate-semialdehyde dehydrogenase/glutarate-semialdehyde dehydrogenase [Pararhizobium capsulatum DSM 1112]|uniref:Succinate-semialdehyde dehydrogenase/glutarate-semialdehyde dehydrogenase n=1 Tax=Pararhizobium capsulatum DSM 1112 TaxID=1121113 RepID=A0ABU0BKY5_9HYPH|nr:NAD-dependent succinate-semialdehyde dehydrogenase [Pararhizobium capsulatum]MDQ0318125.1 succinate-semialdehyde dehydrogenase/glutarate-semialdehyde dehydrogenase [Pararhizobium capsulatum DSM 1112]